MKRILGIVTLAFGLTVLSAAPASARNYDCSKAGNANKTACKTTAAPAPKAAKASSTAKVTKTTTTERNYDCSKAGNKNKATCKTAAAPASAPAASKTQTATSVSYDCTKFYNKMRAVCRSPSATTKTSASTVAPAPAPMARRTTTQATARSENMDAAGATAQCKDGTYSHAKVHTGACSRHGGVAKWN